jgi:hypothetical protein
MDNPVTRAVFGTQLDKKYKLKDVLKVLDDLDLVNQGELTEIAISKVSKVARCQRMTENIDLVTNKQIKFAKARYRPSQDYLGASLSRNTTAPILAVINEPVSDQQYYLHIPYSAHRHLSGCTININFDKDGTPRPSKWWAYKVDSFDDLCKLAK